MDFEAKAPPLSVHVFKQKPLRDSGVLEWE